MELWRRAANPWNQEILIGVSWDLMWAAAIIGVGFVVLHAIWAQWLAPSASSGSGESSASPPPGLPSRIIRHAMPERVFHWGMSAAMFVLLVTAFFPVIGIRFPWVTIHWVAGLVLTALIIYHIIRATFWQDFWAMWIDKADVKAGVAELKHMLGKNTAGIPKAAKYPIDHKFFHHGAAAAGLVAILSGVLMMLRLETPFWGANPYLLGDSSWGVIYVLHGLSGVTLISLVITHIYFAIRPDKWWITKSMIFGWIGREEYLEHHDPKRWIVPGADQPEALVGAASSGLAEDDELKESEAAS